jgi:heme exporter protein C
LVWQWLHRWGSPRWFYEKTGPWVPWLGLIALVLLVWGLVWSLGYAPIEHKQGQSYRIIFIHVPAAFMGQGVYLLMAFCGAVGLIWRVKVCFMMTKAAAPYGAALTFLALVTGAIWGKPTWGTWWEWDARITFMLILLFLYIGIIALQAALPSRDTADKACALLALIGSVNIPLIKNSVEWWYTLHQPATIKIIGKSAMHESMLYPLLLMIFAFWILTAFALLLTTRVEILRREFRTRWVQDLLAAEREEGKS